MKMLWSFAFGALVALGLPGAAWAQQQDLEVTIAVVPANGGPDEVTGEIKLPDNAATRGQESSAFGLGVANSAREMRGELGRQFGEEVSAAARAHGEAQSAAGKARRP